MDSLPLISGLLNIGVAAVASVAIAFFEPRKNVRAALFVAVCVTALVNFNFQRITTAALNERIESARAETAKANEKTAQLEKEGIELRLRLRPLTSQRSLGEEQAAAVVSSLSKFPTVRATIIPIWATAEVTQFTNELTHVLNVALINSGAPKYEGNLPPVIVQNMDNRYFSHLGDGITIQYRRDASPAREFSAELANLLAVANIRARVLENDTQKPEFVGVYVGAIPPN